MPSRKVSSLIIFEYIQKYEHYERTLLLQNKLTKIKPKIRNKIPKNVTSGYLKNRKLENYVRDKKFVKKTKKGPIFFNVNRKIYRKYNKKIDARKNETTKKIKVKTKKLSIHIIAPFRRNIVRRILLSSNKLRSSTLSDSLKRFERRPDI